MVLRHSENFEKLPEKHSMEPLMWWLALQISAECCDGFGSPCKRRWAEQVGRRAGCASLPLEWEIALPGRLC